MMPSGPLPRACWTSFISLLLVCCLLPPGTQGQEFQLRVEPQNPVVPAGESLLVNCSIDCPSAELISLETSLLKESAGSGLGWAAFHLSNVTGDTQLLCSGFCNGSQMIGFSNITVYRFPERVELAPLPQWQPVGEHLIVRCMVSGGAPRDHLTVVLLREEKELGRQPAGKGEPAEVTVTVPARRDDHGANFSCRTELDLRSQGLGLFQNSSAPRKLRTFGFQGPNLTLREPNATEGTTVTVTCAAGPRVQVTLDGVPAAAPGQPAHLQLNATAKDDRRTFFCNATLEVHGVILHRNRSVQLRVLYGPKIDRAKCPQRLTWKDRTMNILQCQARGNPNPKLQCLQEGSMFKLPVGIPFLVRLNYSGTYYCQAESSRGTDILTVMMDVQGRNPIAITIALGMLTILGLVILPAALLYVFGVKKRHDIYRVRQSSTQLPLASRQPEEAVAVEVS
ncbi:intercellular adhesion molecule 3 [Physeter macrocephalus]|uniref:Intercellular adhesion molecule 3 n=1 Tax=Physeter macrocephalus TaxID=9755 RepID=A0A455C342_PHYMC|nr:intercellular adhesion molecule 3 [Physeter catodon]|eukprot:XP_028355447.1 intercellular adhesion molecule 3 [Physeter catodon]